LKELIKNEENPNQELDWRDEKIRTIEKRLEDLIKDGKIEK